MHHFLTGLHLFCCCLYAESSLLYKEEALAWVNPLLSFFPMKFPFQVGPILTRIGHFCAVGQERSRTWQHWRVMLHWESQLRSFTNQDVICALSGNDFVCAVRLLRDRETRLSFVLHPQPFFLFFIFNYFFNIWGERNTWQEAILE